MQEFPIQVILVHGTWGRGIFPRAPQPDGNRWFERQGRFRKELSERLSGAGYEWTINEFLWSGSNSIESRASSAVALTQMIEKTLSRAPACTVVLIAHSHGGNVAASALRHLRISERPIYLVSMATPFITIYKRKLEKFEKFSIFFTAVFGAIWLLFNSDAPQYFLYLLIAADPTEMFGMLMVSLMAVFLGHKLLAAALTAFLCRSDRASSLTAMSRHGWRGTERLLVLRAVDDEAAMSLAAGSIANRLSKIVAFIATITSAIAGALFIYTLYISDQDAFNAIEFDPKSANILSMRRAFEASKMQFSPVMNLLTGVMIGALALLAGLAKAVFGRELLFGSFGLDLDAQSVPDAPCSAHVITLARDDGGNSQLRHALYDHPETCANIVAWLMSSPKQTARAK